MTKERWRLIEELFEKTLTVDDGQRRDFLERECGSDSDLLEQVWALVQSDSKADSFVEEKLSKVDLDIKDTLSGLSDTLHVPAVQSAGPYRLVREIGRGGMGTVYLGERSDGQYLGQVAVKIVRPGMDTEFFLRRFSRERQALARLHHPNIARLLDSGTIPDGSPYIVMELVEGVPINVFCREGNLSVRAILRLFFDVCRAVAHAHQNFIVHRDLKPGNILVEPKGTPKLLDFGICKLLEDVSAGNETMTGAHLMTPAYASPEQVKGDPITVASDVYALGAVLYELLTEKPPHEIKQFNPQEIFRSICEVDVKRPSAVCETNRTRSRELSGDLDTILLKCLQKDPARRYASVEQLSDDLRRVLDDEPVLARPDTTWYRAGKFVRRHRLAVVTAAVVGVGLTVGLIAYARQAAIAHRQSIEARRMANMLLFDIHDKIRNLPGSLEARETLVRTGLEYLDRMTAGAAGDEELLREVASGYLRIGDVQGGALQSNKGDSAGALASYRKGLAAISSLPDTIPVGTLRMSLHHQIALAIAAREGVRSLDDFEAGIAIGERLLNREPRNASVAWGLSEAYGGAAILLRQVERREKALTYGLRQIDLLKQLLQSRPGDTELRASLAAATSNVAAIQSRTGYLKEALANLKESTSQWEELYRMDPNNSQNQRNRMLAYSHLGDILGNPAYPNLHDTKGAMTAFAKMLEVAEQQYRANPSSQRATIDFGMALARVAGLPLHDTKDRLNLYARADGLLVEAIRRDPANSNARWNLSSQRMLVGDLMAANGNAQEARQKYLQSLAEFDAGGSAQVGAARIAIDVLRRLAEDAARRKDTANALQWARRAVAEGEKAASNPAASVTIQAGGVRSYAAMASVQALLGNAKESAVWKQKAADGIRGFAGAKGFSKALEDDLTAMVKALP